MTEYYIFSSPEKDNVKCLICNCLSQKIYKLKSLKVYKSLKSLRKFKN